MLLTKLMASVCRGRYPVGATGGVTQSSSAVMGTGIAQTEGMKSIVPCAKRKNFHVLGMVSATLVLIAATTKTIVQMAPMKKTASFASQGISTVRTTAVCLKAGCVIPRMTVVMAVMRRTAQSLCPPES